MAKARAAVGGAVRPARIASMAARFQSVIASARAAVAIGRMAMETATIALTRILISSSQPIRSDGGVPSSGGFLMFVSHRNPA
jgi:hypothetical protein